MGENEVIKIKGFLKVQGLLELERAEKWDEARNLLFDLWNNDKDNIDKLCRVVAECWYVLTEWDCCINNEDLSFDSFKETLIEATQYGLARFDKDADFLWIAGYMISLFPYLFYDVTSNSMYLEWEQKGKNMLSISTQMDPDNLISKVLCLGAQGTSEDYVAAKKNLSTMLEDIFDGHTAIEVYFKDILSA